MVLDLLAAIIEAIKLPKYEDTEEYMQEKIRDKKQYLKEWELEILDYFVTPKTGFPEEYGKGF
jgi:hypothetical protein